MTAEQFAYWLQGFLELSRDDVGMSPEQIRMVREHLATVFVKVTPPLAPPTDAPIAWPAPIDMHRDDWWAQPSVTCTDVTWKEGLRAIQFC